MGRKYLWGRKASLERRKWKIADYQREYYNRNRDKRLEYMKEQRSKRWQEKKDKWNKYQREYYISRKELFRQLEEENKKLKSDLEECECSFWFENDEVWYRKREYKRLKKWIKDHCKWYWNLFPEDEMKRQWKKADKKRK